MALSGEPAAAVWLAGVTRARANRIRHRVGMAIAYMLGLGPAALFLGQFRSPGYGDVPLVAALFVLGPAIALAVWCVIDRECADLRELILWLSFLAKERSRQPIPDPVVIALDKAITDAAESASRGAAPREVLAPVRSVIQRHFAFGSRIGVFVAIGRFGPAVYWVAISLALVGAFVVLLLVTPECGAESPTSFTVCH